jgi:RNA polymerase sigma factor (sigma-70 family)
MSNLNFLTRSCLHDDARQQKAVYERYYNFAFSVALRYIRQQDKARFIVNDSFIKLFRSIDRFDHGSNDEAEPQFMAWLKKIVINTAIDELRRRDKPLDSLQDASSEAFNADHSLLYKELTRQVKSLPKSYSTVLSMHVIDGFKHREIANHLGISVGTSKSNLCKAKICLRKLIDVESNFSQS